MRAFVFPGQGSQAVGMGRALCEAAPAARAVFEAVDEALGQSLSRLIFEGPDEELRLTANTQPALMACSIAALRCLEARAGRRLPEFAGFVAGHSLGEYTALAAAGALPVEAAARLLRLRGEAMQRAVPVGEGAMAAVIGLDLAAVEAVAAEASAAGVCDVANDNAPGQVVVSGAAAAVERAVELARARGARRSMLLPVSAPFHCRLMAPAAAAVAEALETVPLERPAVPVVCNVTARAEQDPAVLRARLVEQVTGRVRWRESLEFMAGQQVTEVVELGAGRVLAGLARRAMKDVSAVSLGTPDEIEAWITNLGEDAAA